MGLSSNDISLLFKAVGDTSSAKQAFNDLHSSIKNDVSGIESDGKSGFTGLAQAMGLSSAAAGGLAIGVAAITVAFTTAIAIGVELTVSLFNLTKNASEYGSVIHDARDKTGLTAEALTTLKVAADNSGSSFEQVTSGTAKFAKTLGEARDGNDKAQASLKALGVTSYDLDTALSQATKTIFNAKDGTDQIVLSQKAFGKSGADLIPVIKQFGGDLAAATKEAERLGITLSESDVNASDNFGDALGTLSAQAKAAAVAFTSYLMPVLTSYFTSASEWYARNQEEVRLWGFAVAGTVQGMADDLANSFKFIQQHADELRVYLAIVTLGISELAFAAAKLLRSQWAEKFAFDQQQAGAGVPALIGTPSPSIKAPGGGGKSAAKGKADSKASDELRAQIDIQKLALKELEDAYKEAMKVARDEFKKTANETALTAATDAAKNKLLAGIADVLKALDDLEKKAQKDPTKSQIELLDKQQRARRAAIDLLLTDDTRKTNDEIFEDHKKTTEAIKKLWESLAKAETEAADASRDNDIRSNEEWAKKRIADNQEIVNDEKATNAARAAAQADIVQTLINLAVFLNDLNDNERKRKLADLDDEKKRRKKEIEDTIKDETEKKLALEAMESTYNKRALAIEVEYQKERKRIAEETSTVPIAPTTNKVTGSFLDTLVGGLASGAKQVATMQGVLAKFGEMAVGVFNSVANAVGNMVSSFVLTGSAGTTFRKFTAEILAMVAQQAAVLAVMCLAYAALSTTAIGALLLGGTPAQFLQGALLFGAVAGVAAVAGRVVAGDAFKNQANAATGQTATAGGSQQHSDKAGQVFSSLPDTVQDGGNTAGSIRPIPVQVSLEVGFKLNERNVLEIVKDNVRSNGPLRQMILNTR